MKSASRPRPTITRQLWLGFGLLVFLLALVLLIYYTQSQRIDSSVVQLVSVQEPLERAVLQMQVNVDNTAQAVSHYARNRDLSDAEKVHDSEVDFGKLTVEFSERAQNDQVSYLGQEITRLYEEFRKSAYETIILVDKQYATVLLFREDVEELGDLIGGTFQAAIEGTSPDSTKKLKATLGMQESLDEVSRAIDTYIAGPAPIVVQQILDGEEDFRRAWASN